MKKIVLLCLFLPFAGCNNDEEPTPENPGDMPYNLVIDPSDFRTSDIVGNDFFPLPVGKRYVFEGEDEDGNPVRVTEEYTTATKVIIGVTCVVVRAREWVNDELIEDTDDWYAQDNQGNVWYFGEATQEIENGNVVSTGGSWESGVDGALPGIIMLADPIVGMWYRQEYYKGEAEDVAQVLSLNETLSVSFGSYSNCLQVTEWNVLEPGIIEHKIYAKDVGLLKAIAVKGESGFEQLTAIENL